MIVLKVKIIQYEYKKNQLNISQEFDFEFESSPPLKDTFHNISS